MSVAQCAEPGQKAWRQCTDEGALDAKDAERTLGQGRIAVGVEGHPDLVAVLHDHHLRSLDTAHVSTTHGNTRTHAHDTKAGGADVAHLVVLGVFITVKGVHLLPGRPRPIRAAHFRSLRKSGMSWNGMQSYFKQPWPRGGSPYGLVFGDEDIQASERRDTGGQRLCVSCIVCVCVCVVVCVFCEAEHRGNSWSVCYRRKRV
jgi:hypothetical protein